MRLLHDMVPQLCRVRLDGCKQSTLPKQNLRVPAPDF